MRFRSTRLKDCIVIEDLDAGLSRDKYGVIHGLNVALNIIDMLIAVITKQDADAGSQLLFLINGRGEIQFIFDAGCDHFGDLAVGDVLYEDKEMIMFKPSDGVRGPHRAL